MRKLLAPSPVPLPEPKSEAAKQLDPNRRQRRAIAARYRRHVAKLRALARLKTQQAIAKFQKKNLGPHQTYARQQLALTVINAFKKAGPSQP